MSTDNAHRPRLRLAIAPEFDPLVGAAVQPADATSAAELVHAMRQLKAWSGYSYRDLSRRARGNGDRLAASTIATSLARESLPGIEVLTAFVRACGVTAEQVAEWERVWRELCVTQADQRRPAEPAPSRRLPTPTYLRAARRAAVTPMELPSAPSHMIGRGDEFDLLDRLATAPNPGTRIIVIEGDGGIGKTWLALVWAHRNLDRFPDGQVYLDARGFDPVEPPTEPLPALQRMLGGLGVPADDGPADVDRLAALLRTATAGKRMLIFLDNVRDAAQVMPLLPGGSQCTVLVTSRRTPVGLIVAQGAEVVRLGPLTLAQMRELFEHRLGSAHERIPVDAVEQVLPLCAGSPLAISVLAARLSVSGRHGLAGVLDEVREVSTRLDALDGGDLSASLRGVLGSSYRALDEPARQLFRLFGHVGLPDLTLHTAAVLAGRPTGTVAATLRQLTMMNMMNEYLPGRYGMHDLARLYAAEVALAEVAQPARDAASQRVIDFYLTAAWQADGLLFPHRMPVKISAISPVLPELSSPADALHWFATEYACLEHARVLATRTGAVAQVWLLTWAADTYRRRSGYGQENLRLWGPALEAAKAHGDPFAVVVAHHHLGMAYGQVGDFPRSIELLEQALALAEPLGEVVEVALLYRTLSWSFARLGDHERALAHAERSLTVYRHLGGPLCHAEALNAVGWCAAKLGRHEMANEYCTVALAMFEQFEDPNGHAMTLDSLGYIAFVEGDYPLALERYEQALVHYRAAGNTFAESLCLTEVGDLKYRLDRPADALAAWRRAAELVPAQHSPAQARQLADKIAALG